MPVYMFHVFFSAEINAGIRMNFKKISDNAFVLVRISETENHDYYEERTLYRWGDNLPTQEDIYTEFVNNLYEEELNIPEQIVNRYEENPNSEFITTEVEDLLNLQTQLKK